MNDSWNALKRLPWLALPVFVACNNPPSQTPSGTAGRDAAPGSASGSGEVSAGAAATAVAPTDNGGSAVVTGRAGGSAADGGRGGLGASAGTRSAGAGGAAGTVSAAGASGSSGTPQLAPTTRNPKYSSLAPPMGMPIPSGTAGTWTYLQVDGALSRDGSPAGFYAKFSKTGSKNVLVYLAGGGVCADGFFCNMNPPNKDSSLTAENVGSGIFNILGPTAEAQDPTLERWQSGIFKDDPSNPAADWNMVFIPYVTGDVFFGSKPDGSVPNVDGAFQFVGKSNMQKFLGRIIPTFGDAPIAIIAGSSAGGIGALLNATYFADGFIDQGHGTRVFVLDDAGPFFDDEFLEVCIQKRYRDLFALNDSLPSECVDCFSPDGGHLVAGMLSYLTDKYPDNVLGGFVDSDQDEIMKFFFSEGQDNCSYIEDPITGLLVYPDDRYPAGLTNLLDKLIDPKRMSSYIWSGDLHQNLFQTDSDDRFYEKNGLDKTVAEWFATLITGQQERLGVIQ
jgi:hypothetical protein